MAGRATYTEADKAKVYVVLQANDGNVKRTARETGVPENTVRRWRDEWERNGPPNTEEVEQAAGEFVTEAISVRDTALHVIKLKLQLLEKTPDKAKLAELTTVVGVLDDKIARTKGLGNKTPEAPALPSPDELRGLIAGFTARAVMEASKREAEIIDAEVIEEQPVLGLPAPPD